MSSTFLRLYLYKEIIEELLHDTVYAKFHRKSLEGNGNVDGSNSSMSKGIGKSIGKSSLGEIIFDTDTFINYTCSTDSIKD